MFSQGFELDWANEYNLHELGANRTKIVSDNNGNVYMAGTIDNTAIIDFDFSQSVYNVSSGNGNDQLFISKYDKYNNLIWVKKFTSSSSVMNPTITIDSSENILLTALFNSGTIDVDPNAGVTNLQSASTCSLFIKLDSNGNFIWAKNLGNITFNDINIDQYGAIYSTGSFASTVDFDPGIAVFNLTSLTNANIFILKLDIDGNFTWAKSFESEGNGLGSAIRIDSLLNVYCVGSHSQTTDFDSGSAVYNLSALGDAGDPFVLKLDPSGNFLWANTFGSENSEAGLDLKIDSKQNVIIAGEFNIDIDIDSGIGTHVISGNNVNNAYVIKYDKNGTLLWGRGLGSGALSAKALEIDELDNIIVAGRFGNDLNVFSIFDSLNLELYGQSDIFILKMDSLGHVFDGNKYDNQDYNNDVLSDIYLTKEGDFYLTGYGTYLYESKFFLLKYKGNKVTGRFFKDVNENCTKDDLEMGLNDFRGVIFPGGKVVQSNAFGYWYLDSLDIGEYILVCDSLSSWKNNCEDTVHFTISNSDEATFITEIGLSNEIQCSSPNLSISMPFIRRCFEHQKIYIQSCNDIQSTSLLENPYSIVELDSMLIFESSTLSYSDLGNNRFRFNHSNLYPNECVDFEIDVTVSCDAALFETICVKGNLFPVESCVYDTIPSSSPIDFTPCSLPWDNSSLIVEGWCQNDSIYFNVTNSGQPGDGDMSCFSPVRIFLDGQYLSLDSLMLNGGESKMFIFSADGRTWRLEADQHPRHPGDSHGNTNNWTPNLISILPPDDTNTFLDIFCGPVTGSYDPNDKTGYPLGVGSSHLIQPNGQLDYLIRFQNTGTDTAFTVVIRDTLDFDLNIFTVNSGVSSHPYTFRMHDSRVLEWTFNNILLPDSTTNETESHGFVMFRVNQNPNLADSTEITNNVGIFFDFNDPIITNTTLHKVGRGFCNAYPRNNKIIDLQSCELITYNSKSYNNSGTYFQIISGYPNIDTLLQLNIKIKNSYSTISESFCGPYQYTSPDNQIYSQTGTYMAIIPNSNGCDSIITINLAINNSSSSIINETACFSYAAPDNQIYTQSGTYEVIIANSQACDSIITINLTVNNVSAEITNNSPNLIATATSGSYQWVDCLNGNQALIGETNQSFTAPQNGEYAVIVSQNSCSDTSGCLVISDIVLNDLKEFNTANFSLFPNPTTDFLNIIFENSEENISIKLMTLSGQIVLQESNLSGKEIKIDLSSQAKGMYLLEVEMEGKKEVMKVIKE